MHIKYKPDSLGEWRDLLKSVVESISQILNAAAPYGPAVAIVALVIAAWGRISLLRSRIKIEAIRRARMEDIPSIAGDEVTIMGITAKGLTREQRHAHILAVPSQRELRSKRNFHFSLLVSGALLLVADPGYF